MSLLFVSLLSSCRMLTSKFCSLLLCCYVGVSLCVLCCCSIVCVVLLCLRCVLLFVVGVLLFVVGVLLCVLCW